MQGLSSNGRFTGVRLRDVLKRAGVGDAAREVVFFGADRGKEDVVFRQQTFKIEQQFARSITLENAQKPEPMLVYALNGPAARAQQRIPGAAGDARLVRRGQREVAVGDPPAGGRFLGNFQARWYRTMRTVGGSGGEVDPETQWVETEVTHLNLKSVIARVTKNGSSHRVRGWVLNDGTPLKSVEVKVDDGPWKAAVLDPANTKHSWKLFTYTWDGATPGRTRSCRASRT
jgi:hypothetical protein